MKTFLKGTLFSPRRTLIFAKNLCKMTNFYMNIDYKVPKAAHCKSGPDSFLLALNFSSYYSHIQIFVKKQQPANGQHSNWLSGLGLSAGNKFPFFPIEFCNSEKFLFYRSKIANFMNILIPNCI